MSIVGPQQSHCIVYLFMLYGLKNGSLIVHTHLLLANDSYKQGALLGVF